jgi:hypothetical protein
MSPRWRGTEEEREAALNVIREMRQRSSNLSAKLDGHAFDVEDMDRVLNEPLPTRYENPLAAAIIRRASREVTQAAANLHLEIKTAPGFGTLPTLDINAQSMATPECPNYLVIVDGWLFAFINEMNKIALQTMRVTADPDGGFGLDSSDETFAQIRKSQPRLRTLLAQTVLTFLGRDMRAPYFLPPEDEALWTASDDGIELFVVGHEFGHVIAKHRVVPVEATDANAMFAAWKQELEADTYGLLLMASAVRARADKNTQTLKEFEYGTPLLFFTFDHIVQDAKYVLEHGEAPRELNRELQMKVRDLFLKPQINEADQPLLLRAATISGSVTHPPAWLRRQFIQHGLDRILPSQPTDQERLVFDTLVGIDNHLMALWLDSIPTFIDLAKKAKNKN